MTEEATDPNDLPNGAGDGDTDNDAPDSASGGTPSTPNTPTEDQDGQPIGHPAG